MIRVFGCSLFRVNAPGFGVDLFIVSCVLGGEGRSGRLTREVDTLGWMVQVYHHCFFARESLKHIRISLH